MLGGELLTNPNGFVHLYLKKYYGITLIPCKKDKVEILRNLMRQMLMGIIGGGGGNGEGVYPSEGAT